VVNLQGRSHDVHNLWIVDASVLPSCLSVGIGLTVIANALRVAAHVIEQLLITRGASTGIPLQKTIQYCGWVFWMINSVD
jgi:choline dehydrogenase-like flavoprotein